MRVLAGLIGRLMAVYVRLVAATARIEGSPVTQEQVVLAFWHEYNLVAATAAYRLRRGPPHVSFSTQTFRGEVMNAMLAAMGAGSVPLPAEGERAEAARLSRELARLGREGATVAVSPDGPVGPYRRAKPGALIVARESGLPLQPWAISAHPSIRLSGPMGPARHPAPLRPHAGRGGGADPRRGARAASPAPRPPAIGARRGRCRRRRGRESGGLGEVLDLLDDRCPTDRDRSQARDVGHRAVDRQLHDSGFRREPAELVGLEGARAGRQVGVLAVALDVDQRQPVGLDVITEPERCPRALRAGASSSVPSRARIML